MERARVRRPCRDRPDRPRHARGRARRRRGGRAAGPSRRRRMRVQLRRAVGRDARPRVLPPVAVLRARSRSWSARRADRVRRGREMVSRLQGLGVALEFDRRPAAGEGRGGGPPARRPRDRPAGRRHGHPRSVRPLHRPGPAGVRGQGPARVSRDRGPGALGEWPGFGGAHQGARHAVVPRAAASGRASTPSRSGTRATIRSCGRGSRTSRCGSGFSGPAAATGTAILSRARPMGPSAPSRCRSNG